MKSRGGTIVFCSIFVGDEVYGTAAPLLPASRSWIRRQALLDVDIYISPRTDLKAGLMVACWSSLQAATGVGGPMLPVQCHEPQSGIVHKQKIGFRSSGTNTHNGKSKPSQEACCH